VALNTLAARRAGTVGRVLEPTEVQIAADGEVLVRGPGCATGYLEESTILRDADGWLHTGDRGRFTPDGFLCLEGRSVEIFKLSTGRKVAPAPIEAALRRAPGVDHAMLLGAGRKCTVAIVTLTPDAAALPREACIDSLSSAIQTATSLGEEWSRPAALLILWHPFSIAGGDITANLKLRRQAIAAKHAAALERLYQALERNTDFREDDGSRCCLMRLTGSSRSA
jgi:long-chain acyl-CoA synthetase